MNGRVRVSYDDITLPYVPPTPIDKGSSSSSHPLPPAKKVKTNRAVAPSNGNTNNYNNRDGGGHGGGGGGGGGSGNGNGGGKGRKRTGRGFIPVETNRELTHEEIWDDSALVGAWDAAMEEYEAFNGTGKDWKEEPVFKSPLWYNVPPARSNAAQGDDEAEDEYYEEGDGEEVETNHETAGDENNYPHPTQALPYPDENYWPTSATAPPAGGGASSFDLAGSTMVSQDEAFSRALNAMYWGGYWTAMYHCQRNIASGNIKAATQGPEQNVENTEDTAGNTNEGEDDSNGMNTT